MLPGADVKRYAALASKLDALTRVPAGSDWWQRHRAAVEALLRGLASHPYCQGVEMDWNSSNASRIALLLQWRSYGMHGADTGSRQWAVSVRASLVNEVVVRVSGEGSGADAIAGIVDSYMREQCDPVGSGSWQ